MHTSEFYCTCPGDLVPEEERDKGDDDGAREQHPRNRRSHLLGYMCILQTLQHERSRRLKQVHTIK